jgi:2-keto-3-deoxy-L-rhamnonate aldolase RhmA
VSIIQNQTKRKMRAGEVTLGFGVYHLRTASTAMLAAATDHDWLFLDMEHGAASVQDITQICLAAISTGVTPIPRVCSDALSEGTRALDNGALGIVVPHVDTVDEARRVARTFRYPPIGTRSWGGPVAQFGFKPPGNAEAQAAINDEILVIAMIESSEGVANAAAIAAVEGIDALLVGASDLTAEMGISGQINHPRLQDAFRIVSDGCRAAGKFLGMGGVYDEEAASRYLKLGVQFVLTGSDHTYLLAGATQRSAFLRKQIAQAR